MKAAGELFLSRLKPHGQTAADGTFVLTLQAYDRQGARQVQPWRLIWAGLEAKTFWDVHKGHLLPGAVLEVTAHQLRQITTPGRECGPEIMAQVKSLYLPVIAANLQQRPRRHNPGQQACGA